jgi:hypothetical protein
MARGLVFVLTCRFDRIPNNLRGKGEATVTLVWTTSYIPAIYHLDRRLMSPTAGATRISHPWSSNQTMNTTVTVQPFSPLPHGMPWRCCTETADSGLRNTKPRDNRHRNPSTCVFCSLISQACCSLFSQNKSQLRIVVQVLASSHEYDSGIERGQLRPTWPLWCLGTRAPNWRSRHSHCVNRSVNQGKMCSQ